MLRYLFYQRDNVDIDIFKKLRDVNRYDYGFQDKGKYFKNKIRVQQYFCGQFFNKVYKNFIGFLAVSLVVIIIDGFLVSFEGVYLVFYRI